MTGTNAVASPVEASSSEDDLGARVRNLARVLGSPHFPAGDRAALKRWSPGQAVPLAFYRLWLRHLGTELPPETQTAAWMLLTWGLALMGAGAHRPDRPLGRALAEARYAEGRLERLLEAPDQLRPELLSSAVRFLAAKDEGFDWTQAARLLLVRDPDKRNALHRGVASTYYRSAKE